MQRHREPRPRERRVLLVVLQEREQEVLSAVETGDSNKKWPSPLLTGWSWSGAAWARSIRSDACVSSNVRATASARFEWYSAQISLMRGAGSFRNRGSFTISPSLRDVRGVAGAADHPVAACAIQREAMLFACYIDKWRLIVSASGLLCRHELAG